MTLGIISDIHADYDALRAVQYRLDSVHHTETILCAGDLTGYGKQPEAVVSTFIERDIPTVRGNHDAPTTGTPAAHANYLRSLPATYRTTISGKRLFMCHGIPGVNFIGITPALLQRESARAMLAEVDADILIAGHTHQVLCQKVSRMWVLNPGSVYTQSANGTSHSYGVLDLEKHTFEVYDLLAPPANPPIATYELL